MHVIVTGYSGVLGRAVIAALSENADRVVGIDQAAEPLAATGVHQITGVDLTDPEATRSAMQQAASVLGHVDAVVHLVGAFSWIPVETSTVADWRSLYTANVETTLNVAQAALLFLAEGGNITCVGAASAQPAGAGMAPYGASKSAVARLVEGLSQELRPRRIRVNAIAPAIIDTPRNRADMPDADPRDWTTPAAIAEVIRFLCTPASRALNGAVIPVTNNA
ncbi:SDR family oxidoreductase [Novosphingobium sp.]|uniref:SDR family oxidoreductase n=1 Tax=Novosphingobium sp. TaxID=1874826 RepID=UPI0028B0ED26|nr:SDR family oxidoreductase [Novosphingobium sp.]